MSAPYDLASDVLNAAKVRLGEKFLSLSLTEPNLLDYTQAATQQAFNSAWRKLQAVLNGYGFSKFGTEVVFTGLPALASVDPAARQYLNWSGFFDGVILTGAAVLPADMIQPTLLWERTSDPTLNFTEMSLTLHGLPSVPKTPWNDLWDWRGEAIYLPGSTVIWDLRIRYASFAPDFFDVTTTPWWTMSVPIVQCLDAFAGFLCWEVTRSIPGVGDGFLTEANAAALLMAQRDTSESRTAVKVSERLKMSDPRSAQEANK